MILFKKQITKALISLRGCAGWSALFLFANSEDRFSRDEAHIIENFPVFLQLFKIIWETTANPGEILTQSCAVKYEGFFALYRIKFDLVL